MTNKPRRSSSMCSNINKGKRNDFDDCDENKCYEMNPYYSKSPIKNNYEFGITNYDGFFNEIQKRNIKVGIIKSTIQHPDGRIEYQSRMDISKDNPRRIINTYNETKIDRIKDFDIKTETKSYKTGLIFKDTHYYDTQKIIPKFYNKQYQRTVTHYNDGTFNYGDWWQID